MALARSVVCAVLRAYCVALCACFRPGIPLRLPHSFFSCLSDMTSVDIVQNEGTVANNSENEGTVANDSENELTAIAIQHLEDPTVNPYRGSVPVERIQNAVRMKVPELYRIVIGSRHGSWKKYVANHTDVFELFPMDQGKWRLRLLKHEDYKAGDEKEMVDRAKVEKHFIETLCMHLKGLPEQSSTVDHFLASYPELPCNVRKADGTLETPVPPRGDLVRYAS